MSEPRTPNLITLALIVITLAAGIFSSILFTELGQFLNLPSSWLYTVYPNLGWASMLVAISCLIVIYLHFRYNTIKRGFLLVYVLFIGGMIFITNYFVPEIWLRGHHHTAEFISVEQADRMLDADDDVFVIEIDGDARAYPREWMMIPHIAGDTVGGADVVMTYCALSNLPLAFDSYINDKPVYFKVVSQVHNNLVMVDENSGELYQQIKSGTPDTSIQLGQRPAQRMPWLSFKKIYPEGQVFHVVETGILGYLDQITYTLFVNSLDEHYYGEKPLFPTLNLQDKRLPIKEKIWGINLNGEQVAYARSFFEQQPLHNTRVGDQPILVAWFPEFDTLGVFSRQLHGEIIHVNNIDVYGNSDQGKLARLPQYPQVFWMVWSHWFPETRVNR